MAKALKPLTPEIRKVRAHVTSLSRDAELECPECGQWHKLARKFKTECLRESDVFAVLDNAVLYPIFVCENPHCDFAGVVQLVSV